MDKETEKWLKHNHISKRKELTIKEAGSLGGKATLKKHGKEYFKELIRRRWGKKKINASKK